jgi:hypothetical protein
MRVDRDGHLCVLVSGHVRVHVVKIQPVRLRVDLECAPTIPSGRDDLLHVDIGGLALADQPPSRVRDDGDVGIFHRPQQAVGLRLPRQERAALR